MTVSARGFRIFHHGDGVDVIESSIAFEGAHVRVYGGRGGPSDHVQLSFEQAKIVKTALDVFITEALAGMLTEPADSTSGPGPVGPS